MGNATWGAKKSPSSVHSFAFAAIRQTIQTTPALNSNKRRNTKLRLPPFRTAKKRIARTIVRIEAGNKDIWTCDLCAVFMIEPLAVDALSIGNNGKVNS
jgi:hypothetical protein